jgi:transcriptional regulator with XRE-family HTH domain
MSLPPLAVNLRNLRKARGLTQDDLADAAGVWQATVSCIERGYRSGPPVVLDAIAGVLGVDLEVLRDPSSCGNCAGQGLPGYTCNTCGTAGGRSAGSVAA